MPTPDDPDRPAEPAPDVLAITDEEWIAASQACCGLNPVDDDDDDPPATAAPAPGTP